MLEKNYNPDDTKSEEDSVPSSFLRASENTCSHSSCTKRRHKVFRVSLTTIKEMQIVSPEQIYYKHDFRPVALGSHGTNPVPYEIKIHQSDIQRAFVEAPVSVCSSSAAP